MSKQTCEAALHAVILSVNRGHVCQCKWVKLIQAGQSSHTYNKGGSRSFYDTLTHHEMRGETYQRFIRIVAILWD